MYRGTTPTHIFNVPIDTAEIKSVRVIYSQGEKVVLKKELSECSIEEGRIIARLTQEETLLFDCHEHVTVQLRVLTKADDALISRPVRKSIGECLDDEGVLK